MESVIALIKHAAQVDKLSPLLDFLLSQEERDQLDKRVRLAQKLLAAKQSQRDIACELGVSMTTITRCSNLLKSTPKTTRKLLQETR